MDIEALFPEYKFRKVSVLNTFERPWPNGYRDYNCRIMDLGNQNLVGELQLHLCPIKLFSQTVGHLSYEILRELDDNDTSTAKIRDALQRVVTAGYDSALNLKDNCCFDKIGQLNSGHNGGKKALSKKCRYNKKSRKTQKRH